MTTEKASEPGSHFKPMIFSDAFAPIHAESAPAEGRPSFQVYDKRASHMRLPWRRASVGESPRRRSSVVVLRDSQSTGVTRWLNFTLRDWDDDDDADWWFASTAIPLMCATIAPLANVFSIAALVTYWRTCLVQGVDVAGAFVCTWNGDPSVLISEIVGITYPDPQWCFNLNVASLVLGFAGNVFLLFNFTGRIPYIVALPATIILWFGATAILTGILVAIHVYAAPAFPAQTYTQGFWYAVMASVMYMICSVLLMINMVGFFLGHYARHFHLTDSQKTLILQSMMFFFWLAGGAGVFNCVEYAYGTGGQNWTYVDALYFCDVTILTVGFGDIYPGNNVARGFVLPFSVGGIIMLGLMISSISKFAGELGSQNVIKAHVERSRARTIGRTVTSSLELQDRLTLLEGERPVISAPIVKPSSQGDGDPRQTTINIADDPNPKPLSRSLTFQGLLKVASIANSATQRRGRTPKLVLLREEKDRFDAMRHIQADTARWKRWSALTLSVLAFAFIWCFGAVVFWLCERNTQEMSYFEALYFCYVSLLTIGYGDLAPKSNPGRPFFVLWSLLAVPSMTILVSDLGDTVISKFKHGTNGLADFTVLPKHGVWRAILQRQPKLLYWLQSRKERHDAKRRLEEGLPVGPEVPVTAQRTIDELAKDDASNDELARRLPDTIKQVVIDMKGDPKKRYTYEEWVSFTQLIRFSAQSEEDRETEEAEDGLVAWDWIGEDSPMMFNGNEAEFVLERLCESLGRWIRQKTTSDRPPGPRDEDPKQEKQSPSHSDMSASKDSGSGSDQERNDKDGLVGLDESGPRGEKAQDAP